jgi:hypothetical protein
MEDRILPWKTAEYLGLLPACQPMGGRVRTDDVGQNALSQRSRNKPPKPVPKYSGEKSSDTRVVTTPRIAPPWLMTAQRENFICFMAT